MFSDLNKIWLRFGYVQATTTTYDEGKIKARVTVKSNIECWSDKATCWHFHNLEPFYRLPKSHQSINQSIKTIICCSTNIVTL